MRDAVKTVQEAAEALEAENNEAQKPMLRLNLREARGILVRCCTTICNQRRYLQPGKI